LEINGKVVQKASTADMIFSIDQIVSYVSGFFTLKTGDLIFTGTPSGVGTLRRNDHLTGRICDRVLLDMMIK
ncbi:MAG TPA: fumarylacetoacetate hydrolase family protein, partial [Bacteroidales bacterium]|nr:fumarylacetoacetate hydrolase family protein [Bacteroidales bacterium]